MQGKVVHFEIPADDVKRAGNFYKKVFGWQINPVPQMDYTMVGTTPSDENGMPKEAGAINGGMPKREMLPSKSTVVTIQVDDIDAAFRTIEQNGGKAVGKKMPVGDMGFAAYFKDTEGNIVGLFQGTM